MIIYVYNLYMIPTEHQENSSHSKNASHLLVFTMFFIWDTYPTLVNVENDLLQEQKQG